MTARQPTPRYRYSGGKLLLREQYASTDDETNFEPPPVHAPAGQLYAYIPHFELESGVILRNVRVGYTTCGQLNAERNNAVVVCHALSGTADARNDWWQKMYSGRGASLGRDGLFVICLNVLGSPYGTTCPVMPRDGDPASGPWRAQFPQTTIRDDVQLVLDQLGVRQVAMAIGGSMGGMQALEWAWQGEDYVRLVVAVACGAQQSAWAIAWNEVQRSAIRADAGFHGGNYDVHSPPTHGVGAARAAAMLTYRAPESLTRRFGRRLQKPEAAAAAESPDDASLTPPGTPPTRAVDTTSPDRHYVVQSYLSYQQDKFNTRFDANCYISITQKIDSHDVARGRSDPGSDDPVRQALQQISQPTLIIGVDSDVLYPLACQEQLAAGIPDSHFEIISSDDGHDAFLLEQEQINALVNQFMDSHLGYLNIGPA